MFGPGGELRARPLEAVIAVAEALEARPQVVVLGVGVVTTTVLGRALPNTFSSTARRRGGSKCSITSTSAAAS